MGFVLAYATSWAAMMPYILSGIKIIIRNRNYELEYLDVTILKRQWSLCEVLIYF